MSTCATFFFAILILLVTTNASISSLQNPSPIQLALASVLQTKNMVQTSTRLHGYLINMDSNNVGVALSDCAKLYDESEHRLLRLFSSSDNYTDHDAQTWLSSVLANHRSCLDGLEEKSNYNFVEAHEVAQNLTNLLNKALVLYGNKDISNKGNSKRVLARPRRQKYNSNQNSGLLESWNTATLKADLVVARDGSGTHKTINEALDALRKMGQKRPNQRVIVYVKAGVYHENVEIDWHLKNVMFVGDGIDKTIVTGTRNVPDGYTTYSSATFGVSGDGFWVRDMTFENTAGPQKHQAVALRVNSDLAIFYRCSFRGYQDTLFTHSLRQFYRDCHIYGTIDFIFGDASVVLQNCDIFVRRPMSNQANMITAQGRENPHENTGIAIHNSRIRPAPEFGKVKNSFRTYLGRPWKKYSRTVYLKTDLDGLVDPKGWNEWIRGSSFGLSTLFYAEYMNTGIGASTTNRVNWPGFHVLKSPQEASPFSVGNFIQGGSWIPGTGVPFSLGI